LIPASARRKVLTVGIYIIRLVTRRREDWD